jgi:hypothetical protein
MELISLSDAKKAGLKRYFTGVPCASGHLTERMVSSRTCFECTKNRLATYRIDNREELLKRKRAYAKQQRLANPEHVYAIAKKSTAKHRTKRNQEKASWSKKNAARVLAWCRNRQLAKLQRTPAWLSDDDKWLIEQAYELAALRTKMFGFPWHVDHVLPLQGRKVSGLHTPINLQVIPGVENSRKGNRYGKQVYRW